MKTWGFIFKCGTVVTVEARTRCIAATFIQNFYGPEVFRTVEPRKFDEQIMQHTSNPVMF